MDDLDFTEDEIREQLQLLGYSNVTADRLHEFKRDLEELVKLEKSKDSSLFSNNSDSSSLDSESQQYRSGQVNRVPLDEANNRVGRGLVNPTTVEHVRFGKENHTADLPVSALSRATYAKPLGSHAAEVTAVNTAADKRQAVLPSEADPDKAAARRPAPGTSNATQQRDRPAGLSVAPPQSRHIELHPTWHDEPCVEPAYRESLALREEPQVTGGQEDVDTTLDTTTSSERRVIKRKILRKKDDGQAEVFETESEADDIGSLEERLRNLPISVHYSRPSTAPAQGRHRQAWPGRQPHSARDQPAYRLPDDFEGPKALIRPMSAEPHTKNIRKADPVSRGQQYRESWQHQRAPGEKAHKGLRWNVREHMLYHDTVVEKKQQRVFVPNGYRVPSDKKRKNLRWQIRNDLAQGVVPPSMYD